MSTADRVGELEKALDQCLAWAGRLQRRIQELESSRTWRAQSAVAEAAGSVDKALALPAKLSRILKGEPGPAEKDPPPLDPPWPDSVPLLSIAALGQAFEIRSTILPDCEIIPGGLEGARGRYCAFATSRTPLSPTWFERAVLALENDLAAAVCYSAELNPNAAPFDRDRLERFNPVPTGAVFRRELWDALGGMRLEHSEPERDFWLRAAQAGYGGRMLGREGPTSPPRFAPSGRFPRGESFSATKPCLLLVLPWLAYGGAEQVALQLLEGLRDTFDFAVAAVEPDEHLRRSAFEALTPWVYCLDELGVRDPGRFLAELAKAHEIRGALISSTGVGYRALSAIDGLWRADIVHNAAPEGHLGASAEADGRLNVHFAVGGLQQRTLCERGVQAEKVVLAPNGVDASLRFSPDRWAGRRGELRAALDFDDDDYVFAYIARLSPEKRPDRFVLTMSMLGRMFPGRSIRGLIAGDGPERLNVERWIRDERLRGDIRTLGFTERIPEALAASDCFVLTSEIEGSPLTLLEAMSMGLPCVSTDVGAVAEVIRHDRNGLLVRGGEAGAIADACARLLAEPELGPRLGAAARELVLAEYDISSTLGTYREAILTGLGPTMDR